MDRIAFHLMSNSTNEGCPRQFCGTFELTVESTSFGARAIRIAQPLFSHVTLADVFPFYEPQFPHLS